jgi:hypothetical protein
MNSSIINSKSNVSVIPNLNNYTDLVDLVCEIVKPEPEFPNDLFTLEQRRHGAIILHLLAAAYIISRLKFEFFCYLTFTNFYLFFK